MTPQSDDCFALHPMDPKRELFGVTQGNSPQPVGRVSHNAIRYDQFKDGGFGRQKQQLIKKNVLTIE